MHALHFRAGIADLAVNLIQAAAFLRELVFARLDFLVRATFRFHQARHFRVATLGFGLEFIKLVARMVRIENLKIGQQRLIAARFARLALERPDLALHFLYDVADPEKIRFGRFQFAQRLALLRFVLRDSGRFFKNGAAIFRTRAQNQIDLALLHD